MTRESEDFRHLVEDLAQQTAADLARLSFEQVAEQLLARLQKASRDRQKRDDLKQQLRRYEEERATARQETEGLTPRLDTMCQEAGCRTPEELPEIEQSSAAVARIRENLQSLDDQLAALDAGAAIDCFVSEAEIVNADELPGEVQRLSEEIQGLESQRDEILGTIAVEEQALAAMDSGDETTEAAEEAQTSWPVSRGTHCNTSAYGWRRPCSATASSATARKMKAPCCKGPARCSAGLRGGHSRVWSPISTIRTKVRSKASARKREKRWS